MKLDPKWSFILTVLLFAGIMIGLSMSVLNDVMAQSAPLSGRNLFVMGMHVVWLVLWVMAIIFALKFAFQSNAGKSSRQTANHTGTTAVNARPAQNPAMSEH